MTETEWKFNPEDEIADQEDSYHSPMEFEFLVIRRRLRDTDMGDRFYFVEPIPGNELHLFSAGAIEHAYTKIDD